MTLTTAYIRPPIPTAAYDWMAHFTDDEGEGPTGRGATEVEALRDLCERLRVMLDEAKSTTTPLERA
jgi:hypothetical protein